MCRFKPLSFGTQSIIVIQGLHTCKFACSPTVLCDAQINTRRTFTVTMNMRRAVETLSWSMHTFPDEAEQVKVLPSCFNSHIVHGSFSRPTECHVFWWRWWWWWFLKFLLVASLFKMISKHRAEVFLVF